MPRSAMTTMPEGLQYHPEFLSPEDEQTLIAAPAPQDWDGRGLIDKRGRIVHRRELDFLHNYVRNSPKVTPGLPLPEFLTCLRARVAEAAGILPHNIKQVITALYRPGAGIDWHTDSIKAFGDTICGISLGSACNIKFRKSKTDPTGCRIALAPRSLLIMQGPARWEYQHHFPAVKHLRYSITLRTLKEDQ